MKECTITDIADVNKLNMSDFAVTFLNGYEDILVVNGDMGRPQRFRVEIRFIDVAYVACAPSFLGWVYSFRMATEEEAEKSRFYADDDDIPVYCFEEQVKRLSPPLERDARNFFIAAKKIHVTLYYHEDSIPYLEKQNLSKYL